MSCSLAILVACGVTPAAHADASRSARGELASAETSVDVEANEHAPRLATLQLRGAAAWNNRAEETLPDHIWVRSEAQPLIWRLDRPASRFESKLIEIVYVTDSPRLKLVSQWRARAGHGPIEHTILIQNLSSELVWLPLQPSLRFDWQIDSESALERFWVEKGADTPSSQGMHLDALHDGDSWQGASSTYARPTPNLPREMIPYVLVDEPGGARRGWYIGIEFSGRNLATWTKYTGLDPEVSNFGNQSLGRFQDVTPYPPSRQFYLTIATTF